MLVPYVALCLFGGLRPFEAQGLDWSNIDLETKHIHVLAHTSKKREGRYVRMEPTLVRWLRLFAKPSGAICGANFRRQWESLITAAGYRFENAITTMREGMLRSWANHHADGSAGAMPNYSDIVSYREAVSDFPRVRAHLAKLLANAQEALKKFTKEGKSLTHSCTLPRLVSPRRYLSALEPPLPVRVREEITAGMRLRNGSLFIALVRVSWSVPTTRKKFRKNVLTFANRSSKTPPFLQKPPPPKNPSV